MHRALTEEALTQNQRRLLRMGEMTIGGGLIWERESHRFFSPSCSETDIEYLDK